MSTTVRALLLSDTHLGLRQADRLIEKITPHLAAADVILHAGDITDPSILEALADHAPVHAVLGNNDFGVALPQRRVVDVGGCRVAMVHDSGDSGGRASRLLGWFPDADVVVFGHSHIPWNRTDARTGDGRVQHHVNPGSAMQRRSQPRCTIGWLTVTDGHVAEVSIEPV